MNVDGEIRPDQLMTLFGVMGIPNFQLTLDPGRAGQPARGK
jgi:hypothetical protein